MPQAVGCQVRQLFALFAELGEQPGYVGRIESPAVLQLQQLLQVRDLTDPERRRRGSEAPHGTRTCWSSSCSCAACRGAQAAAARAQRQVRANKRLPVEVREQFLAAIHAGRPFRQVLGDLGLTSNQVWGLARTDSEWSAALEAALKASRRDDLRHGTNAAYVQGCMCKACRDYQQLRLGRVRR